MPAYAEDTIGEKRQRALDTVDQLPPGLRECANEYGLPIVNACLENGIREPRKIRNLVREIWEGPRNLSQRGGPLTTLDWILVQAGCPISAATLVRILHDNHHYIVPLEPTKHMLDASLAEVSGFSERMTKREKHRRRIRAAILAGIKNIWPQLGRQS